MRSHISRSYVPAVELGPRMQRTRGASASTARFVSRGGFHRRTNARSNIKHPLNGDTAAQAPMLIDLAAEEPMDVDAAS